ncbi:uncharacterized protein TNCV_3583851 [Trichonephila clavipes]|nr:uncharacterized protein TNCV_3583851 [Trichonephila clavipes]
MEVVRPSPALSLSISFWDQQPASLASSYILLVGKRAPCCAKGCRSDPRATKKSGTQEILIQGPLRTSYVAAVAEWYRYRIVACLVTSSSPVPLKTRSIAERCTLNLSRVQTSSRWCGVVVRGGGASTSVVHVT